MDDSLVKTDAKWGGGPTSKIVSTDLKTRPGRLLCHVKKRQNEVGWPWEKDAGGLNWKLSYKIEVGRSTVHASGSCGESKRFSHNKIHFHTSLITDNNKNKSDRTQTLTEHIATTQKQWQHQPIQNSNHYWLQNYFYTTRTEHTTTTQQQQHSMQRSNH